VDLILGGLEGSVVGALFKTNYSIVSQLRQMSGTKSGSSAYPLSILGPLGDPSYITTPGSNYLSARVTNLVGESYLYDLQRERKPDTDQSISIPIIKHHMIEGIHTAVSAFGLRALRVLYQDESTSEWLGNPAGCWLGTINGKWSSMWEVRKDVSQAAARWQIFSILTDTTYPSVSVPSVYTITGG
jgi:hypothetical protein